MRVILASPRGFCAGVNMAVDSLELAIDLFGTPIYVFHEIVHNKHVVDSFRAKGAVFVADLEEVPEGQTVLFSAHGVAPDVRRVARQRRLRAIDATCPLVTKVHREAVRFAREGYTIVLIGHAGHDEVIGTMGEAPAATRLVESPEDVERLDLPRDAKIAYLTQTTLSVDDASRIIERLRARYPQVVGPPRDDICYATQNRQEAVRVLARDADVVLVVGSQNSSNSRRLQELAAESGIEAYLIDQADDIRAEWLEGKQTVLVTAGASAPESIVDQCLAYLCDRYQATVERRSLQEEHVTFPLPRELRIRADSAEPT
ncbi:MAG: 4-hydroxy-3-methylbut-2-enyl diphosphate reductase [Pirellulaceae bacterium]|nr:4-hydroxy-3-methylbut-2-enyl diphosphate reductase [Pirellulaceae bacterium]